ncbi:Os10g0496550 [Oryza sativa Japonica Group]|uniref:Os10g0496550 protein n=1 Tax=Oryza sativa subsp. japonica TaxID=39947 RepID=A0A0N7KS06_ORYSJ|nr:hypothetical protein EE612_052088 [Oryza sativa]BAT11482.1 Os10g0496550 [Oryza sativa Japonica Group]
MLLNINCFLQSSHNFCQLCSTRRSQLRVSIGGAS